MIQILSGTKQAFKKHEVTETTSRKYRELRASNILKVVMPNDKIAKYLPDKSARHYRINQEFILAIVGKLEPEYFQAVTKSAHDIRY